MFDSHIHSNNSPDSRQSLDEICLAAIEKGIFGIAITDHAHMSPAQAGFFGEFDNYNNIKNSISDTFSAKERYKDRLKVLCGIEMGEYLYDKREADRILALADFDVILGSVHYIESEKWQLAYSKLQFESEDEITGYLALYFKEIMRMVDKLDFDVLTHLTCPLRYINGKHKKGYDAARFRNEIEEILKKIIDKNIALEINTAGLCDGFGHLLCPEEKFIKMYYDLGGRLITLGSDAHRFFNIGLGFDTAISVLKKIGFEYYSYYEKRQPKNILI